MGSEAETSELLPVSLGRDPGGMFNVPSFGCGLPPSLCSMSANWRDVERRSRASHGR